MFIASTATMLISDNDDNLIYHSKNMKASEVNHDDLLNAKREPVIINNISRLSSKPIRGGYIYWLEDIKELLSNLKELEDSKDELKDANIVEQENIKAKKELERLRVNNQIYDLVLNQTKNQSHVLANLLDMYKKENDHSQKIAILGKILVIGTYLKRKSNLIIISYQNKMIDANELALCIKESIRSLDACNKNSAFVFKLDGYIEKEKAMLLYDLFEYVVETCFDKLETLLVIVKKENDELSMQINIEYDGNLEEIITNNNLLLSKDFDDSYVVSFRCKEGENASV